MKEDAKHLKNERAKQWMKDNKEKVKLHKQRYRMNLKERVFKALGSFCIHCGITDQRVLQIDHRFGGGSKERKELSSAEAFYRRVIKNPSQYQILCANCNWIKRHENREINEETRIISEAYTHVMQKKSVIKSPLDRMFHKAA